MKQFYKIFLLFILIPILSKGQDPQFTQFYSVPMYLGPSFAGATIQQRLSSNYRRQWMAIPADYATFSFAYDYYFYKYNSGLGIMFMQDQAGTARLGTSYIDLLYSYDFAVFSSWHLRPGISFSYLRYNLNFNKLLFGDQVIRGNAPSSVETPPSKENRGDIDGSFSTLAYNSRIWVGITVDHLLQPNISLYNDKSNVPIKYSFYGGAQIIQKGKLLKPDNESVSVAYLFRMQGAYKQLDLGLYWYNPPYMLGFWYRGIPLVNSDRGDAVAILAGLKFSMFSIGYSYDFTVSNLVNSTAGAHELSISYEFTTKRKKHYHALPCPQF
jgi:type IX secretion system PorP/SprF family membrane protein